MKPSNIVFILLTVGFLLSGPVLAAKEMNLKGSTFAVEWYNVGQAALEGRPGIVDVESGWQGSEEINRVRYDPEQVSIEMLEDWLKEAGTYKGTLSDSQKEKE